MPDDLFRLQDDEPDDDLDDEDDDYEDEEDEGDEAENDEPTWQVSGAQPFA